MAKGSLRVFNRTVGYDAEQQIRWLASGSFRCALISDGVDVLLDTETLPGLDSGNINQVAAGGGYTNLGIILSTIENEADTETTGIFTFRLNTAVHTDGKISWTQQAGSPTNIKTAVVYDNDTGATPSRPCLCYIDLTEDGGTTAVNLEAADIDITFGQGGNPGEIMKFTVSN